MATIKFWDEEAGKYYSMNYNLVSSVLRDGSDVDYYIQISVDLKDSRGNTQPTVIVRTLSDTPDASTKTNWSDVITAWLDYFVLQAEVGMSSSSSSMSSSSSSYVINWSSSSSTQSSQSLSSSSSSGV